MNRRLACAATLAATLGFSSLAQADPIILSSSSGIAVLAHAYEGGTDVRNSLPFARADVISQLLTAQAGTVTASASASLNSSYADPAHMWGSGATTATFDSTTGSGDVSGSSQFLVRFQLDAPHAYDFDATFGATGDHSQAGDGYIAISDRAWIVASLYRDLTPVFAGEWFNDSQLARNGVLAPGIYSLRVHSGAVGWNAPPGFANVNAASNFAFRFDLTESAAPVPEPASVLLFGTGLVGTIARLRRRRA